MTTPATEIANAREREASEERQVLFPIRLVDYKHIQAWHCFDADRGTDSAKEIREYFIPDFTNWKDHDAYTESFERLLEDLKAETSRTASGDAWLIEKRMGARQRMARGL